MTEQKIRPYVGTMDQLARIRTSVLDDGRGRGIRIADIDNGSGLRFAVFLDRGMDLGDASFNGVPFAYQTPVGLVHPSHFESDGFRWLRSFGGGLMTGCGLRNTGIPKGGETERVDGPLGLHGRLSNTPAEDVSVQKGWKDGQYCLSVSGIIREVSFFSENLELRRTISTAMGENTITITDEVTNRGVRSTPVMMLYHINAGFPLLDENAVLEGRVESTVPRNDDAAQGLSEWSRCQPPTPGYLEQCFLHEVEADDDGLSRMTLRNQKTGMALQVASRKEELPYFLQWKMMGEQEYVVGIEPCTCHPDGPEAGDAGIPTEISAGETIRFKVVMSVEQNS